jgi:putative endonuclease
MGNYFVYILQSDKDFKYYVGYTTNIEERLLSHNAGRQKSTKNRIPFRLVYSEKLNSKTEALARERKIKSYKGGNAFKKLLNLQPFGL